MKRFHCMQQIVVILNYKKKTKHLILHFDLLISINRTKMLTLSYLPNTTENQQLHIKGLMRKYKITIFKENVTKEKYLIVENCVFKIVS